MSTLQFKISVPHGSELEEELLKIPTAKARNFELLRRAAEYSQLHRLLENVLKSNVNLDSALISSEPNNEVLECSGGDNKEEEHNTQALKSDSNPETDFGLINFGSSLIDALDLV